MRIGVDASCWANDRGYGRFAREILSEMTLAAPGDDFVFLLDSASRQRFSLSGTNVHSIDVHQSKPPTTAASAAGARSPIDILRFTRAAGRAKLDVLFCPSVYTFFPLPPGLPSVVAIHDAIAERFPSRTLPSLRARLFWKAKVRLAILQSTLVLSVSEFAADDVSRVLGVPRTRIRVAVEAPSRTFTPSGSKRTIEETVARWGLASEDQWFIYVGGFNPHKNVDVLIRGFARVRRDLPEEPKIHLLLVGTLERDVFHSDLGRLRTLIQELGVADRVIFTDFVEDADLRHLYSGAVALVLPSDLEGFGLPAAEAAACGTPVIATTQSPLPNLLSGGGIFVDPRDEEGLTEAIRILTVDCETRESMAETALEQAKLLSWKRCARQAMEAIREAAPGALGGRS